MKRPSVGARKALNDIKNNTATVVPIRGTSRVVKVRALKDYTIDRITQLWLKHDMKVIENANDTMKQYIGDPYLTIRQCCLVVLNSWWKINLFYGPMVFLWSKVYGYTQEQLTDILAESKKKLSETLTQYWMNMAFLTDMRSDAVKMMTKEAEQYQVELLLAAKQSSSANTQNTEGQGDSSSV